MDFYKAYDLDDRWAIAFTRDFDRAEPVVYFLDKKYKHTNVCGIECQITCGAYYVSTLLGHKDGYDLCLAGDIPAWTVPAETVALAKKYCQEELQSNGIQNSRKPIKSSYPENEEQNRFNWAFNTSYRSANSISPERRDIFYESINWYNNNKDKPWMKEYCERYACTPMLDGEKYAFRMALEELGEINQWGQPLNSSRQIKSSREESLALAFDRAEYCCKAIFGSEEGGRYQKWYCYGVSYGQDYAFFKVEHTDYSVRLSFEFMDTGFVYVDAYFTNGSSYDSKTIKNWNFEREVEDETAAGVKEVLDSFFDDGIRILRGEEY